MSIFLAKAKEFFESHSKKILILTIILYLVIFSFFSFWKYQNYFYNALDLAIFNQVFYNSAQGNLFQFSVHQQSYLGDHFGLFIIFLLPFYILFKHPITLLILQTVFLGLAAWPLYLIARQRFSSFFSLVVALLFLINPLLQNINLFEFHLISLSPLMLFFVIYYYLKKSYGPFLLFSFLSLLIREDISLIIILFSTLALFEKRSKKWVASPLLMGLLWGIISYKLVSTFSEYESYKFLYYYSFLGTSFLEIFKNFFTEPLNVLRAVFNFENLIFILGLFSTFLLLPFSKIRYLLPMTLIFLGLILAPFSGVLILETHYIAPLLPFLFTASIFGLANILNPKYNNYRIKGFIQKEKTLLALISIAAFIYFSFSLGPIVPLIKTVSSEKSSSVLEIKNEFANLITDEASLITGYDFLSNLSSREKLYPLHYVFLDRQQYSTKPYSLPQEIDNLLIDFQDLVTFQLQYEDSPFYREQYPDGDERLRDLIEEKDLGLVKIVDTLALYQKGEPNKYKIYEILESLSSSVQPVNIELENKIKFLAWEKLEPVEERINLISLAFYWQSLNRVANNYQLKVAYLDQNNSPLKEKIYPLAYGLYPTSKWQKGEIIKTSYQFLVDSEIHNKINSIKISLVKPEGFLRLNGIRSAEPLFSRQDILGQEIKISDL